jgi:hypothetical protein
MSKDPTREGRVIIIRLKTNAQQCGIVVIHNNCLDRMTSRRRQFIQISALSAFDGTVLDYRGYDG